MPRSRKLKPNDAEKMRAYLERYDTPDPIDALWCCEGTFAGMEYSWYSCVILIQPEGSRPRLIAGFRGTSPAGLFAELARAGIDPPPVERIAALCESAGSNPRLWRKRRPRTALEEHPDA